MSLHKMREVQKLHDRSLCGTDTVHVCLQPRQQWECHFLRTVSQFWCCTLFVLGVYVGVCMCSGAAHTRLCTEGIFSLCYMLFFCECRKYGTFLLRRALSLQACAIIYEHVVEMCLGFHAWYLFFCSQQMRGECT